MKSLARSSLVALALALLATACGGPAAEKKEDPKPTQTQTKTDTAPKKAAPRDDSPAALVGDAGKLMRDSKYADAKVKYEAALAKDGKNLDARIGLAAAQLKLGEVDAAEKALAALQKEQPESRDVILLLGLLHKQKGDFDAGIDLYKGALEKADKAGNGHDPDMLNNLIVLYRLKGDYDAGVKACTTLLSRDPENVDALKNLSLIYFDQEKYALAETIAINSLKLSHDKDAALYNNRGMIRVKRGRYPEAMSFFLKAVEIDPNNVSAHLNIGSIALRYRDYNTAAKHFGDVMKIEPRQAEANLGYGLALSGQQKSAEAITQLERALEINANATEALGEIAMINKLQLSKPQDAQGWCGKYKAAKGAKLDEKDPMKIECQKIDDELNALEMQKKQLEEMKKQEDEEKAKNPPPPAAAKPGDAAATPPAAGPAAGPPAPGAT